MTRTPLDFATAKVGDIVYKGKGSTRWVIAALYPVGSIRNTPDWVFPSADSIVVNKETSTTRGGNTVQPATEFTTES